MCSNSVVVVDVPLERPSQALLAQNDRVIQTFSSDRADDALGECILPRRSRCRQNLTHSKSIDLPTEERTENLASRWYGESPGDRD